MTRDRTGPRPPRLRSQNTSSSRTPAQQQLKVVHSPSQADSLERFSRLTGPLQRPNPHLPYKVRYTSLRHNHKSQIQPILYATGNIAFKIVLLVWILLPQHRAPLSEHLWLALTSIFVAGTIGLMEVLGLVNVISLSIATVLARDPIPVTPLAGLRVAFLTSYVPASESLDVITKTLKAARRITYDDGIDVWLLDEGADASIKQLCSSLGVHHHSRNGMARYNLQKGIFRSRTKHGNYNSWLNTHGQNYDVILFVDPDHVPFTNFAERVLGYFRDPNVAYVVGPQNYGNCTEGFVPKAAESQQFPFHTIIQRAANWYKTPMLVGTNAAVRVSALRSVGGFRDSITEDMATGLALHASRNPVTGRRWQSVYTPDVLAIGEGPTSWRDYFSQQRRWSRGTFEILRSDFWRSVPKLRPMQILHYVLITTFYPSMALCWIFGAVNAMLYAFLGVRGVDVPVQLWVMLYVDATAFQLWLYIWNRRYNVSPFEEEGSFGISGMLMSVMASPIYASSLVMTVIRRSARFVVTPKGKATTGDAASTFITQYVWATFFLAAFLISVKNGFATPAASMWPVLACGISLAPVIIWRVEEWRRSKAHHADTKLAVVHGEYTQQEVS
jgi:cellulose synthase/poly-beta-1,6-N-acetylglucosamine synthase-like glycosyltransferase